jgi:2-oxoisovalerate dehydrogenase E2 component (dihydrolipoyl transacylase)
VVNPVTVKEFKLPDLGEGLTEGEILKWLVNVGDTIELNQPIVEVETAKAAVEIPAKWAGKVVEIHHPEGSVVEVGSPIIAIDTDPSGASAAPVDDVAGGVAAHAAEAATASEPEAGLIGSVSNGRTAVLVGYGPRTTEAKRRPRAGSAPAAPGAPAASAVQAPPEPAPPAPSGPALAKPPVRKLARDMGIDLASVTGTGPQGSITRDDLAAAQSGAPVTAPRAIPAGEREQRIPVKGVRKLTAANMVESAFTAPHVTEFLTIDMTRSMKALDRLRADREWRDVRVSPLLIVAKAVLMGIQRHPMVNSTWDEANQEIVVKNYVNLGIAAATDRGLVVPNIVDAQALSLRELADAMTDLVQTAKAGKTTPAAMTGGTFSITNVGVFGVDTGTPILPPGEAAILAFGAVRETPWAYKGKVKLRQVTTLGLSFDHRIIDGELGSMFLRDVGAFLTDPEASLLAWS